MQWLHGLNMEYNEVIMVKKTTIEVSADLDKHEAVCAERWRETIYRIKRLEVLIITTLLSLVVGMATILSGQVF